MDEGQGEDGAVDREEALKLLRSGPQGIEQFNHLRLRDASSLKLLGADLSLADLSGAVLSRARLSRARLNGADLNGAALGGAALGGADLRGADLSGARLSGAKLSEARLSGAKLSGANLMCASLGGADLSLADLSGADLRRASLIHADLSGASLGRVVLVKADLREAELQVCCLVNADLTEADLSRSRLIRCDLTDAVVEGAIVVDVHVQDLRGYPKPPSVLRLGDDQEPLTGEDARNFFTMPATVEVFLTERLGRDELIRYEGLMVEIHLRGRGLEVRYFSHRDEASGTVLRFQGPNYPAIYEVLPDLLSPFPKAEAIDWKQTLSRIPKEGRTEAIQALVKLEARRGRYQFAENLEMWFKSCRHARIEKIQVGGRTQRLTIDVITDPQLAEAVARARVAGDGASVTNIIGSVLGDNVMGDQTNANIGGDATNVSIGSHASAKAGDIQVLKQSVEQSDALDAEVRSRLMEALDASDVLPDAKTVATDNLDKLKGELEKEKPDKWSVRSLLAGIRDILPDVAKILESAGKIGGMIGG